MDIVTQDEWWAISLDDFVTEAFDYLGREHDSVASHYVAYHGTKEEAVNRFVSRVRQLAEKMFYESDDYGYRKELEIGGTWGTS